MWSNSVPAAFGPYDSLESHDAYVPPPNPWMDLASAYMPNSIAAMLKQAEYFSVSKEVLLSAYRLVTGYFLTEIKLTGDKLSKDDEKDYIRYLTHDMALIPALLKAGVNLLTYGNYYASVIRPIIRSVKCPRKKCGTVYALQEFADPHNKKVFEFEWRKGFHGRCWRCGFHGDFGKPRDDYDEHKPLTIKDWNPHQIEVDAYSYWEGTAVSYNWVIPDEVRSEIERGEIHALSTYPWELIETVNGGHRKFGFSSDFIHHWSEGSLCGIELRGTGIPRALSNHRSLFLLQNYDRADEAISVGHIMPLRIVSPEQTSGDPDTGSPLKTTNLGSLASKFNRAAMLHANDPNGYYYMPVPLKSTLIGADGRDLIDKDKITQVIDRVLNGIGVPVDFYRRNLQTQSSPLMLKLMEKDWAPFVHGLNRLFSFILKKTVVYKKWDDIEGELTPPSIADSIEKEQARMQAGATGMASRSEALKAMDVDFLDDLRRRYDEQIQEAEIAAEAQQKMETLGLSSQLASAGNPNNVAMAQQQQAQQGGQGQPQQGGDPSQQDPSNAMAQQPGGGEPQVPSPSQSMDPTAYLEAAKAYAGWLVTQPQSTIDAKLSELRKGNELFHHSVRMQMEKKRSEAASQGRAALQQQG